MAANYLFNRGDLRATLENLGAKLRDDVANYAADALLHASVDALVEYFVDEYSVDAVELRTADITVAQDEVDIDISRNPTYAVLDRSRPVMKRGTVFRFHVPFDGDPGLLALRPSSFLLSGIVARVENHELLFEVRQLEPEPDAARRQFEQELTKTQQMLNSQRDQVFAYRREMPDLARHAIEARRTKLLADREAVASLGYPMRVRDDATTFASSSVTQRPKIAAQTRRAPGGTTPFVPEPALSDDDFARVLHVVRGTTTVMERSPSAFTRATEETLRDHVLVQLNGHFEGKAVGEAFNANGKTDILLRDGDRNLLICECKFWAGPKSLIAAVDQIMSYLTWRDARALLIVFNRATAMSTVLTAIEQGIPDHRLYRRGLHKTGDTEFQCVLHRADDPDREIRMTIMVMDVPNQRPTRRSKEPPAGEPALDSHD